MLVASPSALSAVCDSAMPSFALRIAWFWPLICEVSDEAIARPAASSLAELMRLPVDRRSMLVASAMLAEFDALVALSAATLVPITVMVKISIGSGNPAVPHRRAEPPTVLTTASAAD